MDLDQSKGILSRCLPSIHHVNDANMVFDFFFVTKNCLGSGYEP